MEYKTIEELYTSLGVAGAIIVVFLGVFVYTIVQNDKRRSREMTEIIKELSSQQQFNNVALPSKIRPNSTKTFKTNLIDESDSSAHFGVIEITPYYINTGNTRSQPRYISFSVIYTIN